MGIRLMVGQRTLNPYVEVRILDPQYLNVTPRMYPGRKCITSFELIIVGFLSNCILDIEGSKGFGNETP